MRVKICGITNLQDALLAVNSGADAIGFIFYAKSPRFITIERAKKIVSALPPFIQKVGVFVNDSSENIDKTCVEIGLNLAQIHFEADEKFFSTLKTPHIKVIRAKNRSDLLKYKDEYRLIDAFVESFGGEGKSIDLSWFEGMDCSKIILAGGLNADILPRLKPFGFYGVDVNSGVEAMSGKKDEQKVRAFIRAAKI